MKSLILAVIFFSLISVSVNGFATNKSELISLVTQETGLAREDVQAALDSIVANITLSLAEGKSVSIVGFGTFIVNNRAARTGRNPRTGEAIEIEAARVPRFKAGQALKDAVKE